MTENKRYQVFVSSTFQDLKEERQEIIQALLELDCIPAGMELFPAANDDQWTLIKRVIDDCDYYIVVIAGRYGSIGPDGISYTEMEYRYATDCGKPTIGFLHKEPESLPKNKFDKDNSLEEKLDAFRNLVRKKAVRHWSTPADLGSVVSRSIIRLMKDYPAIGWIRADSQISDESAKEILSLKKKIELLEAQDKKTRHNINIDRLASGDDLFKLEITVDFNNIEKQAISYDWDIDLTWNEMFSYLAPAITSTITKEEISRRLGIYIMQTKKEEFKDDEIDEGYYIDEIHIHEDTADTIIIQFSALDLIEKVRIKSIGRPQIERWALTEKGEKQMYELRAIRK